MNSALTWQQIVAIIAGVPSIILGILAFAPGEDVDPSRNAIRVLFAVSVLICVGATIWHVRRAYRADLQPDILAQMVPASSILELGRCHLYLIFRTAGNVVEIKGYCQNLNDGPGKLDLAFVDRSSARSDRLGIPSLVCDLPPAAVVQVEGRFACGGPAGRVYRVSLEGRFQSSGRQVRFARRRVMSKRVSPFMTAAALLGGTIYDGGGTFLSFTVQGDFATVLTDGGDSQWRITPTWLPQSVPAVA